MLPLAEVSPEAQALSDLEAGDNLSVDGFVPLVRSLANSPVVPSSFVEVRDELVRLTSL